MVLLIHDQIFLVAPLIISLYNFVFSFQLFMADKKLMNETKETFGYKRLEKQLVMTSMRELLP